MNKHCITSLESMNRRFILGLSKPVKLYKIYNRIYYGHCFIYLYMFMYIVLCSQKPLITNIQTFIYIYSFPWCFNPLDFKWDRKLLSNSRLRALLCCVISSPKPLSSTVFNPLFQTVVPYVGLVFFLFYEIFEVSILYIL